VGISQIASLDSEWIQQPTCLRNRKWLFGSWRIGRLKQNELFDSKF